MDFKDLRGALTGMQCAKLTEESTASKLYDHLSKLIKNPVSVARWDTKKALFYKGLPALLSSMKKPSTVTQAAFKELEKQRDDSKALNIELQEDADKKAAQIKKLIAAKYAKEAAAIQREFSTEIEQYEKLLDECKRTLGKLPRIVQEALYYEMRGDDFKDAHEFSDFKRAREDDELEESRYRDGYIANSERPTIRKAKEARSNLRDFLSEISPDGFDLITKGLGDTPDLRRRKYWMDIRALPTQHTLSAAGSFEEIETCLQNLTRDLAAVLEGIAMLGIQEEVSLRDFPGIVTTARECRASQSRFAAATPLHQHIGEAYRGSETDLEPIKWTLTFASSIASRSLPRQTAEWLLCKDYGSRLRELRTWLSTVAECGAKVTDSAATLEMLSGSSAWSAESAGSWGSLVALIEKAQANSQELDPWMHFLRVRIRSREAGLHRLTNLAEDRAIEPGELNRGFHFVFYNTLARGAFTQHIELAQVTGITQEELRRQFAASDKEAIRLYSERVALLADKRGPFYGNQSGPVKTWTELVLTSTKRTSKSVIFRFGS